MSRSRRIQQLSILLLLLIVVHDLDHVRQGRGLGLEIYSIGLMAFIAGVALALLALRGHSRTPEASIIVGFGTPLGIVLVHVLPPWWVFNDSYAEANADALSWAIILAMMMAGTLLGLVGLTGRSRRSLA